jgi:two-component system, NtrC family, response regulator AtoC
MNLMKKILVVDDELNMRLVLKAMLKKEGYDVVLASDGVEALNILKQEEVTIVVSDLKMPKLDGMELLERISQSWPAIPVIIITAHGTIATAVDALKKGAFDYITKPFEQDELKNVILKAIKTKTLSEGEALFRPGDIERYGIIGNSEIMQDIYDIIKKVAPTTTTVMITGETGTGKELIANAIHVNSPRRQNPFIKINCAAIPENLMESELFGFEKGAFTGAVVGKPGKFELAHKGTLFLDEVGELSKEMQVKILTVIQDHQFERVGGIRTIKVDVRLITATNRNLRQDVKDGIFREDLFYRLNVFPIHVPPLRERREDILLLINYFLEKFNKKLSRSIKSIEPAVMDLLEQYDWPGNIRELENFTERLVLMTQGETITLQDIPIEWKTAAESTTLVKTDDRKTALKDWIKNQTEEIEKQMITKVLDECGDNVTRAAKQLGMSRKGLQLKMIKYGLRK